MSASGISFGGMVTGMDTDSIINKLISLEAAPISRWQTQQATIQNKQNAYTQLRTAVNALATAAGKLSTAAAFNPVKATSSSSDNATVSATSDAAAGVYALTVSTLAQSQKISSSGQTDTSSALNLSGVMVVNGEAVNVATSDSLQSIANKINELQSGVTASIIDGGSGSAYLTLASSKSGLANKVQLADLTGSVASSLGLVGNTTSIRESITNGATSSNFSSSSTTLATMLGNSGPGTGSVTIKGSAIAIDYSTDTLQSIANKVNSAGISGVAASVRSVTKDGVTSYKLDLTGVTASDLSDTGSVLGALGLTQKDPAKELVAAQDASFTIDGVPLTSSTNTVTTAIPGATITLLSADKTSPPKTTITLTRDDSAVKSKIKSFADTYNQFVDFVAEDSKLDSTTYETGPLFGDTVTQQIENTITNLLFNNVPGSTGTYKNLADIGFTIDTDGHMQIDDTMLTNALSASGGQVATIFRTIGTTQDANLNYVSSNTSTKSTVGGYAINVTQAATKQSFVVGTQQTTASVAMETLKFTGSLMGSEYTLNLDIGSTLSSTVSKINSDSKLKDLVYASIENGALRLDSRRYGTGGNFTVVSNLASGSDNSGIGTGGEGTTVAGLDIVGTIGGEEATGSGQFLTGKTGNANTAGLQVQYAGSSTGNVGTIKISKGVSSQIADFVSTLTDSVDGMITSMDKTLQQQYDDLQEQIDNLKSYLTKKTEELKTKYAAMETAISNIKSQGNALSGLSVDYNA